MRTVTGVNSQNVQLTPPANPGASLGQAAYQNIWIWAPTVDGWYNVVAAGPCVIEVHQRFHCDDSPSSSCRGSALCPCSESCTVNPVDFGNGPKQYCATQFATFSQRAGVPTDVIDLRTQDIIDPGCKPCSLEMGGSAVVTVTDADGHSASEMVTVQ